MIRNPVSTLPLLAISLFLGGCAGAPVRVGDGKIEMSLAKVTGVTTDSVEKTSLKSQLNLWDVYTLAVEKTESLASKSEDIEQAEAQGQQAIGSILPQITLNGSKGWQSSNYLGSSSSPSSNNPASSSLYLSGTETLFTGLTQVAAIQGSKALKDQGHHLLQQESRNLLLNVAKAFYAVLQAEDSLRSKQETQRLTEQVLKQEQQWRTIGRSRDSDVLSTQAELAQLNGDLENIQNQLTQARESLSVLAGLKPDQALLSEETPLSPSLTLPEAEARVDGRSDVLASKAAVDLAAASLLQAHGQHLPSLAVQGNYFLLKEGGSPSPEWNVQLVASLPIFEGGAILAQERLAGSKKRQADLQYSLTRRQALEDIRAAHQNLTSSIRQVDAYGKALDAAKKNYEIVARDRRLALNTNLDLLHTLTDLQDAQNDYNQARYQSLVNWIWFGVSTGELPKIGR